MLGTGQETLQASGRIRQGPEEGFAVSCTANNGVLGGALTTMLTLGIPGDAVTAILIGSLMMYGMQPGPKMFTEDAGFVADHATYDTFQYRDHNGRSYHSKNVSKDPKRQTSNRMDCSNGTLHSRVPCS